MTYFRIKEWETYQHYKDRSPPWIKLHCAIMSSRTWVMLDDASKALAVACMLLAANTDNKIPFDPDYIQRVAYLKSRPDLNGLLETDFIEIIKETEQSRAEHKGKQTIRFASNCLQNVSEEHIATWRKAYPGVAIEAEIAKAEAWLVSNPDRQKSNYARFLNSWFSKATPVKPASSIFDGGV